MTDLYRDDDREKLYWVKCAYKLTLDNLKTLKWVMYCNSLLMAGLSSVYFLSHDVGNAHAEGFNWDLLIWLGLVAMSLRLWFYNPFGDPNDFLIKCGVKNAKALSELHCSASRKQYMSKINAQLVSMQYVDAYYIAMRNMLAAGGVYLALGVMSMALICREVLPFAPGLFGQNSQHVLAGGMGARFTVCLLIFTVLAAYTLHVVRATTRALGDYARSIKG